MDVLHKLHVMMKENNYTEYRLAKISNLSQSTISNIFTRNNVPTIATLEKICSAFGITLSQFFAEEDDLVALTKEDKDMLHSMRFLNANQKILLSNFLSSITN